MHGFSKQREHDYQPPDKANLMSFHDIELNNRNSNKDHTLSTSFRELAARIIYDADHTDTDLTIKHTILHFNC